MSSRAFITGVSATALTAAERELMAAYVSGLNGCGYCHGVHAATAEAFGLPAGLLAAVLADLDSAPVDDRMKPVLRYLATLTRTPGESTLLITVPWMTQPLESRLRSTSPVGPTG